MGPRPLVAPEAGSHLTLLEFWRAFDAHCCRVMPDLERQTLLDGRLSAKCDATAPPKPEKKPTRSRRSKQKCSKQAKKATATMGKKRAATGGAPDVDHAAERKRQKKELKMELKKVKTEPKD